MDSQNEALDLPTSPSMSLTEDIWAPLSLLHPFFESYNELATALREYRQYKELADLELKTGCSNVAIDKLQDALEVLPDLVAKTEQLLEPLHSAFEEYKELRYDRGVEVGDEEMKILEDMW